MKILYIITGLTVGGAEIVTINLASRMQEMGHKVKVMYLSGERLVQVPDSLETINLHMKKSPQGLLVALWKAKKNIKGYNPDLVHANMFHAILFSRLLRLICPVKKEIDTVHTINVQSKIRMFLLRMTDFLSDITTNVSQESVDFFIENKVFNKNKSFAVYNAISMNSFFKDESKSLKKEYGILSGTFVFLNVSRIMPAKDHANLLQAFKIVHEKNRDTKLICVGDGDLYDEAVGYSMELGLKDSVLFVGSKQDVVPYYNTADCFVLSSAWEGFGIVLVEAMACELPVISTDCGGTKEVVQNDNFLVPPKNAELLARKMLDMSFLPIDERKVVGKRNRINVKRFEINEIAKQWISIYMS